MAEVAVQTPPRDLGEPEDGALLGLVADPKGVAQSGIDRTGHEAGREGAHGWNITIREETKI